MGSALYIVKKTSSQQHASSLSDLGPGKFGHWWHKSGLGQSQSIHPLLQRSKRPQMLLVQIYLRLEDSPGGIRYTQRLLILSCRYRMAWRFSPAARKRLRYERQVLWPPSGYGTLCRLDSPSASTASSSIGGCGSRARSNGSRTRHTTEHVPSITEARQVSVLFRARSS